MNRSRFKSVSLRPLHPYHHYYYYFLVLISFHLAICVRHVDSFYTQRQRYASRMLQITPKACTSPEYPGVTGICMISLECQQRSGTVIGACRDGHLFGACCHDPVATSTAPASSSSTSKTTTTTEKEKLTSSTTSKAEEEVVVPSSEKSIENNEISAPAAPFFDTESDSTQIPSLIDTFSELSPTFLSELDLGEHTTGIYGGRGDELILEPVAGSRRTSKATTLPSSEEILTSVGSSTTEVVKEETVEEETGGLGGLGPDPVFKDNMIKYIDEIVTMRNNELAPVNDDIPPLKDNEVSVDDIPFSTFTIVSSTKPSEDPIVFSSWTSTTSGSSNVEVTTPSTLIPSTTTESTPFSSAIKNNKNASEEILSVQIAQTVGPLLPSGSSSSSTSAAADTSRTEESSTEASATGPTKFTFSKLKYTPRPFKPRHTTRRMIWTRPTTTTQEPFWIKPVDITGDDGEDDEEDEEEDDVRQRHSSPSSSTTTTKLSTLPSSTEQTTPEIITTSTEGNSGVVGPSSAPTQDILEDLPSSSEHPGESFNEFGDNIHDEIGGEITSTEHYPSGLTTGYGYDWAAPTIMSYLKGESESPEKLLSGESNNNYNGNNSRSDFDESTGPSGAENEIDMSTLATGPSGGSGSDVSVNYPSWRTSTPVIEETTLRNIQKLAQTTGGSSTWDASIDSFVDQVVDGIVQDLNKSNKIDDMIFSNNNNNGNNKNGQKKKEGSSPSSNNGNSERRSGNPSVFSTTPAAVKYTSLKSKLKSSLEKTKLKGVSPRPTAPSRTTTSASSESPLSSTTSKERLKKVKVKVPAGTHKRRQNKDKVKPVKKVTTQKTTNSTRKRLDYKRDCGVRPLIKRGRIVGGTPSQFGSWPWHALVKETVWWGIFSKIKCGGVLIGPQHVLTAAHCQPQQTGTLSVVLGITDSDDTDSRAVTKTVRRIIPHPRFNPRTYENDIAILELESPVDFQPHIVPICLPRNDEELEGKTAYVTGMGLLKHDGERPLVLQEVDLPILNNTECQKMFVRSGNMKPIIESFICAGYEQGRKDSCGGDSGGPLSVKRSNGQWVLAGTVSHGIKCALPDQPGVYMRTSFYKPWIDRVLNMARSKYRGIPKCNAPPLVCARQRYHQQNQPRNESGFVSTLFRLFRLARKMVEEGRKQSRSN